MKTYNFQTIALAILSFAFFILGCEKKQEKPAVKIVSSDIVNYWDAYDKITATKDSVEQYRLLDELFLDKASAGQLALMEARNYKAEEFIQNIYNYPKFWESIRKNTLDTINNNKRIEEGVRAFKVMYPDMKPAVIYCNIGAFRTPGTAANDHLLIGSEYAMGDLKTITSEMVGNPPNENYYKINPIEKLPYSAVHEYVHTQQSQPVDNLLAYTLHEGIAEFIAVKAMNQDSPWPAFDYGPKNEAMVKKIFEDELFMSRNDDWLWNNSDNRFGTRDMGYFVGFRIAEGYYNKAEDKVLAIKEMIELDYSNDAQFEGIVEGSGYLSDTLENLFQNYEAKRPTVIGVLPNINNSESVSPKTNILTVQFSEPMDTNNRNFDYGPMGENHSIQLKQPISFSEDGKSITFHIQDLEPNKQYQLIIGNGFVNVDGISLKPYLIDFKTK